jgi:hypothetical protein
MKYKGRRSNGKIEILKKLHNYRRPGPPLVPTVFFFLNGYKIPAGFSVATRCFSFQDLQRCRQQNYRWPGPPLIPNGLFFLNGQQVPAA